MGGVFSKRLLNLPPPEVLRFASPPSSSIYFSQAGSELTISASGRDGISSRWVDRDGVSPKDLTVIIKKIAGDALKVEVDARSFTLPGPRCVIRISALGGNGQPGELGQSGGIVAGGSYGQSGGIGAGGSYGHNGGNGGKGGDGGKISIKVLAGEAAAVFSSVTFHIYSFKLNLQILGSSKPDCV